MRVVHVSVSYSESRQVKVSQNKLY